MSTLSKKIKILEGQVLSAEFIRKIVARNEDLEAEVDNLTLDLRNANARIQELSGQPLPEKRTRRRQKAVVAPPSVAL